MTVELFQLCRQIDRHLLQAHDSHGRCVLYTVAVSIRNHFGEHFAATKRQLHDIPFKKSRITRRKSQSE
ncbi:hypothetical protein [Neisseria lactamica]|uniref:hypothetical protein n=1 Tax=Neisseria lactamica TaxID=486 RepID=UPI003B983B88